MSFNGQTLHAKAWPGRSWTITVQKKKKSLVVAGEKGKIAVRGIKLLLEVLNMKATIALHDFPRQYP